MSKKTIVITGCSSGFGRVSALELARRGWHVFATVRKETDQADLLAEAAKLGCTELSRKVGHALKQTGLSAAALC